MNFYAIKIITGNPELCATSGYTQFFSESFSNEYAGIVHC